MFYIAQFNTDLGWPLQGDQRSPRIDGNITRCHDNNNKNDTTDEESSTGYGSHDPQYLLLEVVIQLYLLMVGTFISEGGMVLVN